MTSSANPRPRSQTRITRWGDALGRWNPQLLRQLRGIISAKSIMLAIAASLVVQGLTWLSVVSTVDSLMWPSFGDAQLNVSAETIYAVDQCLNRGSEIAKSWSSEEALKTCGRSQPEAVRTLIRERPYNLLRSHYCTGSTTSATAPASRSGDDYRLCLPDGKGAFAINWPRLYRDSLPFVRGLFLSLVGLGGTYAIAQNWLREVKLGTLEFIRMSPEPVGRVLLGKVLGTPILFWVGALAWIPFHLFLAFNSSNPAAEWLAADMFGLAALSTVFVGALTACVWTGELNVMLLVLPLMPMICGAWVLGVAALPKEFFAGGLTWFSIELTDAPQVPLGVGTVVAIVATVLLWQCACRRFDNPQITPLRRVQAYQIMALFNVIALGFAWPVTMPALKSSHFINVWGPVGFFWILVQAFTIWGTLPQRQTLLDWSRYRHMHRSSNASSKGVGANGNVNGGINRWLWQDPSPNLAVPVVNLVITWVIWSPWAMVLRISYGRSEGLAVMVGLTIPTLLLMFFVAFSTWCLLAVHRNGSALVAKVMMGYFVVSVVVMLIFVGTRSSMVVDGQAWWSILLTALGTVMLPGVAVSAHTLSSLACAGLVAILSAGAMVAIARKTVQQVGASESQALFSSVSSATPDADNLLS